MSERLLPPASHETGDVRLRNMLALLALIGCVLLLMLGLAWWLFPGEVADRRFAGPFPDYPAPRLQPSPRADIDAFRAQQLERLASAGWQDKAAGTVHIPIQQAMALLARDGIPGWPTRPSAGTADRR